jgi:hypothetical protein
MFAWLISHQPAVLFSQNKPVTGNQPTVLFSHNKPAPAISHLSNERAVQAKDAPDEKDRALCFFFMYSHWPFLTSALSVVTRTYKYNVINLISVVKFVYEKE